MFLIRITPFNYRHKIDTVNHSRIAVAGWFFGSSLVVSYQAKQTNKRPWRTHCCQTSIFWRRTSLKDGQGNCEYWPKLTLLFAVIRQLGPAETHWIHLLKILGKRFDNKDYCDSERFNQPLYFCAAYPKLSNWQASCYLNQTTVLSLRHPNLPCIYSQKIFFPLIYSTASSHKKLLLASTCTPLVRILLAMPTLFITNMM